MLIGSILQIYPFDFKPSAPPVGSFLFYAKTDNILYLQDSSGIEYPFATTSAITQLTGEGTATGPGSVPLTLSNSAIIGKVLTGFTPGPNSVVLATDTILQAFEKLQAQVSAGSSSAVTSLTGDVTGTGPGATATTVVSVGGSSAANVHSAELLANASGSANTASTIVRRDASGNFAANNITANLLGNATTATSAISFTGSLSGDVTGTQSATVVALVGGKTASDIASTVTTVDAATSTNTASTLVERDASGNFAANNITANLIGNASGSAASFTGSLSGDVTGTQSSTAIADIVVTGKLLTGLVTGSNTPISATDSILIAFEKLQAQASATSGSAITALTGDVSATGPGSVSSTVNSIGGSSAANIHSAELLANAATSVNTANTIVKRSALGAIAISSYTAIGVTDIVQALVKGFSGQVSDIVQIQKSDGTVYFKVDASGNATVFGTISASNFSGSSSGTNTGDVTKTDTDSIAITLAGQNISANIKLSSDAADAGNVKATTTIHSGAGAGLHVELPFAIPVQVGTSNAIGTTSAFSLSDHVHAITFGIVGGLIMSTYVIGTNVAITAADSIVQAFGKLQAQINAIVGSAITSLTGDITATGPGAAAATIAVGAVTDTKASLANKPACTVVATTNQTLSGAPTIDGQATTAGTSVVLLTAQTTASQNGPWVVQSGAWTRPTWFPSGGTTQAFQFITILVRLGTVYQGSTWRMTTAGAVTIDTTSTTWVVTPVAGNFRSDYTIGLQTGSVAVSLAFANAFKAILSWNPTANFTLTMPPTAPTAGQYLGAADGAGTLQWTNPLVNIDGGSPSSNYVAAQVINGGTP